ncbi:hypothetical protein [Paenibacillus sp. yr247]|nr:hypothetical protein [Paenibacillus sp. yr247]
MVQLQLGSVIRPNKVLSAQEPLLSQLDSMEALRRSCSLRK